MMLFMKIEILREWGLDGLPDRLKGAVLIGMSLRFSWKRRFPFLRKQVLETWKVKKVIFFIGPARPGPIRASQRQNHSESVRISQSQSMYMCKLLQSELRGEINFL